jgi:hypothetical protein
MQPDDTPPAEPSRRLAQGGVRVRMASSGLRWRLTAWIAVVMLLSTGITFVAVYRGTGTQLRHRSITS